MPRGPHFRPGNLDFSYFRRILPARETLFQRFSIAAPSPVGEGPRAQSKPRQSLQHSPPPRPRCRSAARPGRTSPQRSRCSRAASARPSRPENLPPQPPPASPEATDPASLKTLMGPPRAGGADVMMEGKENISIHGPTATCRTYHRDRHRASLPQYNLSKIRYLLSHVQPHRRPEGRRHPRRLGPGRRPPPQPAQDHRQPQPRAKRNVELPGPLDTPDPRGHLQRAQRHQHHPDPARGDKFPPSRLRADKARIEVIDQITGPQI